MFPLQYLIVLQLRVRVSSQSVKAAILKCSSKQAKHLKFLLYVIFSDRHLVIENIFFFFYQTTGTADENASIALVKKMFTDIEERREEMKKDIS